MSKNSTQHILERLNNAFRQTDSDAQIKIRRGAHRWIHLTVIASAFEGKSENEREKQVNEVLATIDLNLDAYPIDDYVLYTPGEVPAEERPEPIPPPLWSETLLAPEPEHLVHEDRSKLDKDTTKRPFVVTFYSFEGNRGQSTALGLVANFLVASGHRVVMLDFDLETPNISHLFPANLADSQKYGVVDYMHARYFMYQENTPSIADCIRRVDTPFRGELYLVPAGKFDEEYIHKLPSLNMRFFYKRERKPTQRLLADVKTELEPDVMLIDAGRGFNAMGAIALLDQAHLGMISFSPTNQNFESLKWVVRAASRQRSYKGIPDLRFLLTRMPNASQSQHQSWITKATEWIAENWPVPRSLLVDELYYLLPYNPDIATLTNLAGKVQSEILEAYRPVADAIARHCYEQMHLFDNTPSAFNTIQGFF